MNIPTLTTPPTPTQVTELTPPPITPIMMLATAIIKKNKPLLSVMRDAFDLSYHGMKLNCYILVNTTIGYREIRIENQGLSEFNEEIDYDNDLDYDDIHDNDLLMFETTDRNDSIKSADSLTNMVNLIEWTSNLLKNLKYDSIAGRLHYARFPSYGEVLETNRLRREVLGDSVEEMICPDCVVCGGPTTTKTGCGHSICLTCATQVRGGTDESLPPCPCCRRGMTIVSAIR